MNADRLTREAALLEARRYLKRDRASDYVAWAVEVLAGGTETPSVTRLAGADLNGEPALPTCAELFQEALRELEVALPDPEAAVRDYVHELARGIVDGTADPVEQVDRIHREVVSTLEHPEDLMVWCYLRDGLKPEVLGPSVPSGRFTPVDGDELRAAILEYARWYVR